MELFWTYKENIFNDKEIDKIISYTEKIKFNQSTIEDGKENLTVRKDKTCFIPHNVKKYKWIYERLTKEINYVNSAYFNFNLTEIEDLQVSLYDVENYYKSHLDIMSNRVKNNKNIDRKLTFSIQLSDENTYSGGDLLLYTNQYPTQMKRKKGTISVFPSFLLHEVLPILSGYRYSLVGWCIGPNIT